MIITRRSISLSRRGLVKVKVRWKWQVPLHHIPGHMMHLFKNVCNTIYSYIFFVFLIKMPRASSELRFPTNRVQLSQKHCGHRPLRRINSLWSKYYLWQLQIYTRNFTVDCVSNFTGHTMGSSCFSQNDFKWQYRSQIESKCCFIWTSRLRNDLWTWLKETSDVECESNTLLTQMITSLSGFVAMTTTHKSHGFAPNWQQS